MKIDVTYMSGAGNLFTVIDNRVLKIDEQNLKLLAPMLCDSNDFKSEGLLILNKYDNDLLDFDFLNPDGSANAMCGNGARCALYFAKKIKLITDSKNNSIDFKMVGKIYKGKFEDELIKIFFPPPESYILSKEIDYKSSKIKIDFFDVGSKHAVINYNNMNKLDDLANKKFNDFDIISFAPVIRHHKEFQPSGVNVNIY